MVIGEPGPAVRTAALQPAQEHHEQGGESTNSALSHAGGKRTRHVDLDLREVVALAPLAVLAIVIGLYPESVLGLLRGSVTVLLAEVAGTGAVAGRP